jgi:hypothetical protein
MVYMTFDKYAITIMLSASHLTMEVADRSHGIRQALFVRRRIRKDD